MSGSNSEAIISLVLFEVPEVRTSDEVVLITPTYQGTNEGATCSLDPEGRHRMGVKDGTAGSIIRHVASRFDML